ncbi:MAG: hypothetical protein HY515_03970 [Candidatus Aenigmarchaeota archaeon]|nr:hypothetical protein [Candidatus Aenigmarchaeota archaeon]
MVDGLLGSYIAVAITGLIHGLEPGHGWPLAVLLSKRGKHSTIYAGASALILGTGHLISSFAVVGVYLLANTIIDFSSSMFRYLSASMLLFIAFKMWRETPEHEKKITMAAKTGFINLAWIALVLGFAHEEEFMLLGFAIGGLDPVLLMTAYSFAVIFSMVSVTMLAYHSFSLFKRKFSNIEPYLPKITAVVLTVLALRFLAGAY